ncbi:MAG: hypothetical protein ABJL67_13620 [Sulfitobacter sp.]
MMATTQSAQWFFFAAHEEDLTGAGPDTKLGGEGDDVISGWGDDPMKRRNRFSIRFQKPAYCILEIWVAVC